MDDFSLSSDDDGELAPPAAAADVAVAEADSNEPAATVVAAARFDSSLQGITNDAAPTPVTLQGILTNTAYHVDRERWFNLLQDDGVEMSVEEKATYSTPVKGRRKNKHYNIAVKGRFYQKLYSLAQLCVQMMKDHTDAFPRFNQSTKNSSSIVHALGRHFASERKKYARADLHSIGRDVGFSDLIQSDAYEQRECFYIYSQQHMLEHVFDKYGPEKENKKVTTDDIVRVICILFMHDDMRSCIMSMVGTAKSGTRQELDAAPAKFRAGFRLLHQRFIDKEAVAVLPRMWTQDETRSAIEEKYGPGYYDTYCIFNGNNHARIALPWTENDVRKIFGKILTEYNALMDKYTMGTGGGPGAPENYGDWWVRPAETVVGYIQQPARFYLTLLFMFDKEYKWIFTTEKDTLPQSCMIDDSDPNFNDTSGGTDSENNNLPSPSVAGTPAARGDQQRVPSSRKQQRMVQALEMLNSGRETSNATATEVLGIMRRMEASSSSTTLSSQSNKDRQQHELVQDIKDSSSMVQHYRSELDALKQKKRKLSNDKVKNKSKLKELKRDIKRKKVELETMEETCYGQSLDLKALNEKAAAARKTVGDTGDGNDDEDATNDDDSSSDDDSSDDDE
jgi:hypothetical protein